MSPASQQINQEIVRTCLTEASRGNYDVHPEEARGAAVCRRWSTDTGLLSATCASTVEQQFSAGDRVATVSTVRGVHAGELMARRRPAVRSRSR